DLNWKFWLQTARRSPGRLAPSALPMTYLAPSRRFGAKTMRYLDSIARTRRGGLLVGILVLLASGCQSKGNISGKITYKDKPLTYGTIVFVGADGATVQTAIKDGDYRAAGVGIGEAQVAVSSPDPKSVGEMATPKPNVKRPPPLVVPGWFPIPRKY